MGECECPTDRRLILNVGRAVKLRNRLQAHAFGSVTKFCSPWISKFMESPHDHLVMVSIWYVKKELLSIAEAVLIDRLKPTTNKRDIGYGNHTYWDFRLPDESDIGLEEIEPDRSRKSGSARSSRVRNEPGVYAWWVDAGAELHAAYEMIKPLTAHRRPFSPQERTFRKIISDRLRSARRSTGYKPPEAS